MAGNAELVLDAKNIVGESIIWDDRDNSLYWVDIISKDIHALAPDSGAHRSWAAPELVTSIGLRKEGGFVVGLEKTIASWAPDLPFTPIAMVEPDLPENRLNEGVVGPDGAFWVGTMQNNINPDGSPRDITAHTGAWHRVSSDGEVRRISAEPVGITNTLVWTDDGRLITADTLENALYAHEREPGTDRLINRTTIQQGFDRGLPDGSCPDAEGYFWNCRVVGGRCVARFSTNGEFDRIVELPCSWPTSCTFGGPDLDQLFVTSARFTMDEDHLRANPEEGGLFAVDVGVRGRRSNRFG